MTNTMGPTFDQIYESYMNGQFKQFREQVEEYGFVKFIEALFGEVYAGRVTDEIRRKMVDNYINFRE